MWIYDQSSGKLYRDQTFICSGYSGFGDGKNKPEWQARRGIGPIPRGLWNIGKPYNSKNVGPYALPLTPRAGTETFNRSAFLIHGDSVKNPGQASHGCIILPRGIRTMIRKSGDYILKVVE